ncbi:MAG TPA: glycine betaine ABC transporter substrate-binding protein [Gemmataceae bacterium]|nr:glycine betaine ABC transporter substrate-binding protein [Gemmataceae bacterium]
MRPLALALVVLLCESVAAQEIRIGSKEDTETPILAEIAGHLIRDAGLPVEMKTGLGGTGFVWKALEVGAVDLYPEYTGTLYKDIFKGRLPEDENVLRAELAKLGIGMTRPLGFANNYALGMRRARAEELKVSKVSDLRGHPDLRLGFSNEFLDRPDGWPGLKARYRLPHPAPRGMDHRLAYEALRDGAIDVTDLYTTDGEIRKFDLIALADDERFFPKYEAVFVYRLDLEDRAPAAVGALRQLEGRVTTDDMINLNLRSVETKGAEAEIAAAFVRDRLSPGATAAPAESDAHKLWRLTREHLTLVGIGLTAALVVALPLGVLAARRPGLGRVLISAAGILQTIPSLALLVLLIVLLDMIGPVPAIVALFLYGLLPILVNTSAGLRAIPPSMAESAEALGLSPAARLWRVELPLASRSILAGVQTAAVVMIGTATLGALIGAGGYGEPIVTGLRRYDNAQIVFGAVPAAVMALAAQGLFEIAERMLVPRGLRLKPVE